MDSHRRFVVVLRGESAARFRPEDGQLQVLNVDSPAGPVDVTFNTRYSDEGFEDPIPREMWVEVRLTADCTLEEAINSSLGAANMLVPLISVSANAPIGDLDVHLAFDATPAEVEHEFFENFLPDETGRPRQGRHVNLPATIALLDAVGHHAEHERLYRSLAQYREALRQWRRGKETFATAHLWMAVEAITPVAMRRALVQETCSTPEQLAALWGIVAKDPRELWGQINGEIRRRLIFHGDTECSSSTRKASDGFEHGYMGFRDVYALASSVRDRAAGHIRQAILELSDVEDEAIRTLISPPFDNVRASWPITMYVKGEFIGQAEKLAAPGEFYPLLRWENRVKSFRRKPEGTASISFEEKMTVLCGEGVEFRPRSHEIWAAENDPIPQHHEWSLEQSATQESSSEKK